MVTPGITHSRPALRPRRLTGATILMLGAVIALSVTTYRYFTPLSGITGAGGALVVMLAQFALIMAAAALIVAQGPTARRALLILSWLGVILTLVGTLFLHGWISGAFLVLAGVGVVMQTFSEPRGA